MDYYDEIGFQDWTHALTGTAALKAQHPEFETWNQGIHARSGVACADCHAENSIVFHAPQESERILARAIDLCRKGQNALKPGPGEPRTAAGPPAAPPNRRSHT